MKKYLVGGALAAIIFCFVLYHLRAKTVVADIMASVGTASMTIVYGEDTIYRARTITYNVDWTSDSSGNVTVALPVRSGTLVEALTNPGSTAPTTLYDISLLNEDSKDVLLNLLADRSATATEWVLYSGTSGTLGDGTIVAPPVEVNGSLTLQITHAGSSKVGNVKFTFIQ